MSLFADYVKERSYDSILETEDGFATYRYLDEVKTVYIVDIYTVPEQRLKGAASSLADAIVIEAKAKGCTALIGTVVPSTKNSTKSLLVLAAYGMKLQSADKDLIIFRKDI